ncbi:SMI1/KNR4 family protein [Streptomyces erythrochromogenes]|uniref:SMI1/KNR4 family protein n=1 Tax=Streptomyces erythrochromogenes TaxID=285574 RepID=UPI0033DC9862
MSADLVDIFGPPQRFRSASNESWRAVEEFVGVRLPVDYKDFVNGYGDSVIFGHLGIPHPEANHKLLDFVSDLGKAFLSWQDPWDESPVDTDLARMIPWAFHEWNGDICLLDPPRRDEGWSVVVAYRQFPGMGVFPGSVTDFFKLLREGRELPSGWPLAGSDWRGG